MSRSGKALRWLAAGCLLGSGQSVFAGEVMGLRCSEEPDGTVRLVVDLTRKEYYKPTIESPNTEHRIRLPRVTTNRPLWGKQCAGDIRVSIAPDSRGGARLLLDSDQPRSLNVYAMGPYRSARGRMVFDLSPPWTLPAPAPEPTPQPGLLAQPEPVAEPAPIAPAPAEPEVAQAPPPPEPEPALPAPEPEPEAPAIASPEPVPSPVEPTPEPQVQPPPAPEIARSLPEAPSPAKPEPDEPEQVVVPSALPPEEPRIAIRTAPPEPAVPRPTLEPQVPPEALRAEPESTWELRGYLGAEARGFFESAKYPGQKGAGLSLVAEPEWYRTWNDDSLSFRPYLRWDQYDDERTYGDIRELLWVRGGDGWEVAAGVGKVFWGVTEAYHLVDVINQTDLIANPDGEQKLGQPMLRGSLERDWGTVTLFALPYFRERTYPGREGRFRTGLRVDTDQARYEDGRSQWDWDWALRWSHFIGDMDVGIAHFHGTGREPRLVSGMSGAEPVLIPVYERIDQTSLDVQYTRGDWLWKLEAMRRSGQGETFWATTGGFEYTRYGIAGTDGDLGVLAEYMYDSRGDNATTAFNQDLFLGLRWTANDVAGSTVLAGVIRDWDNGATAFNLEASRRFGQRWKVQVQARAWFDVPAGDALQFVDQDDYIELGVYRYF